MPIKGLTDEITPRFPRLGKLRKGGEKGPNGFGPDLDHFRFTSERQEIVDAFEDAFNDKPAVIPVYLPYATPGENFQTWKELWSAGGLQHRCDGETMQIWLGKDGKYHRDAQRCPGGCDEVGRLEVIIPQLWLAGFVGFVTLETHSINDILAISQALEQTYVLRHNQNMDLRGLPFNLRRVPEKISTPGWGQNTGKRVRAEKWLVKIEPVDAWSLISSEPGMLLPSPEQVPSLPAPQPEQTPALPEPNGKRPAQQPATADNGKDDLAAKINRLGEQLWPGQWGEKKKVVADAYKDKATGVYDMAGLVDALEKRKESLKLPDKFKEHIMKSWPGFERLVSQVGLALKSDAYDRCEFLKGLSLAAAQDLPDEIRVNIILGNLSESSIPENFR